MTRVHVTFRYAERGDFIQCCVHLRYKYLFMDPHWERDPFPTWVFAARRAEKVQ
jgi:hypothetical protein